MEERKNPFEYEQATKLSHKDILDYYIDDYNYARFVSSRRNIFLVGERGTGKTMTFLFYSLPVRYTHVQEKASELDLSLIAVYVPCNTPLTHRQEFELLDPLNASLASEHFLVTSIMREVVEAINSVKDLLSSDEIASLRAEVEYVLGLEIPTDIPFLRGLSLALDKASVRVQDSLNTEDDDVQARFLSFNSGLRPFLVSLKQLPPFRETHFSLMIDDVQLLNPYQIRALNSWIAYRDNALFSFKVATTRVEAPSRETSSGGTILEGHDFTRIDLEQSYQNRVSAFGKLAERIITSRLMSIGVDKHPEEYFPANPQFQKDMQEATRKARNNAQKKYPNGTEKQWGDYVYKYARAIYFRERSPRANLPPYSGFDLLTHLSTGVIRNLLDPCYHMYDRILSEMTDRNEDNLPLIDHIPPDIQAEVILQRSKRKWEWTQNELDNAIVGCSRKLAQRVYNLLDNLAILFKKRLLAEISEPRAVEFSISGLDEEYHADLLQVLLIAQKAQLIYTYRSAAKDRGRRETYYMPNKILWPERGLDPLGQHARVSITATNLQNAAIEGTEIPFYGEREDEPDLFTSTH